MFEREGDRRNALRAGRIFLASGGVLDCTIRDCSPTGAKLRLANATPLPETFELLTISTNEAAPAVRRWQKGVEAGVVFTGAPRQLDPKQG